MSKYPTQWSAAEWSAKLGHPVQLLDNKDEEGIIILRIEPPAPATPITPTRLFLDYNETYPEFVSLPGVSFYRHVPGTEGEYEPCDQPTHTPERLLKYDVIGFDLKATSHDDFPEEVELMGSGYTLEEVNPTGDGSGYIGCYA